KRVVEPGGYAGAFPLACVGDRVVVPVRIDPYDRDHRFELVKEPPGGDSTFRILKETADRGRGVKAGQRAFEVETGASDGLRPVPSEAGSFGNRPGTATHHSLRATFDVLRAGNFQLETRLLQPQPMGGGPGAAWAFEVQAAGKPLTVTVPRWQTHEYRGKFNT